MVTSREAYGQCRQIVHLTERLHYMPKVKASFTNGHLAESALRILADTWTDDNAEMFARDEQMLLGWALQLPHSDLRMLLDTWKRHSNPDPDPGGDGDRFDSRNLTITRRHDGTGHLDGILDPEGLALV